MSSVSLIMPVTYSRNPEDGFMYENPRPQHNVVMVTLPDGRRYMKTGEQDLLDKVNEEKKIDLSDGWSQHQYSEYGSPAWEEEVWAIEQNNNGEN